MRSVTCTSCGAVVALDDYIIKQCPVCDSFMETSRLDLKVDKSLIRIIRVDSAKPQEIAEQG